MIDAAERRLGEELPTTTSQLLHELGSARASLSRMEYLIDTAQRSVVTLDDRKALTKVISRINREIETLRVWLRAARLEEPRN
jgi:hypothetical protein